MTEQSREILKVGDEKLYLFAGVYPLEDYPPGETSAADYWKITALSTAENRGYAGTWEVRNGEFHLADIYAYRIVNKGFWFWKKRLYPEVYVPDLFPHATNGIVKATWFTGRLAGFTRSAKNPVNDRLSLTIEKGNVVQHQWFHLEGQGYSGAVPFDKPLP